MKKLSSFILAALVLLLVNAVHADAYVSVKGYYRSNGTYVAPYVRSNPNGLKYDNYSYTPSQGLYNSTYGTRGSNWDTPTWITDSSYYEGKSLYEQNQGSYTNSSYYLDPYYPTILPTKDVSYVAKSWADNNPYTSCEQATFLRVKEKSECNTYKSLKYNYSWNVTTNEFDGKHYSYDPESKVTTSCPDSYVLSYDTNTGKPLSCNPEYFTNQSLPSGCLNNFGYSVTSGLSCSGNGMCAPGLVWRNNVCA